MKMNEVARADLASALEAYREAVAEVMEFANAWHDRLMAGDLPSPEQIGNFQSKIAELNTTAKQRLDHYFKISASALRH